MDTSNRRTFTWHKYVRLVTCYHTVKSTFKHVLCHEYQQLTKAQIEG